MSRELLVSVVGGRAVRYVNAKKPSDIIPFRGSFPILEPYQMDGYLEAIQKTEYLDDLPDEYKEATIKGNKIAILVEGFTEYLSYKKGLSKDEFLKLPVNKRSYILIEWMDEDKLDFNQLNIL